MNEHLTVTGDIAQFKRISIPLIRQIYPMLIANKIVSECMQLNGLNKSFNSDFSVYKNGF